jgi:hypothetical protein
LHFLIERIPYSNTGSREDRKIKIHRKETAKSFCICLADFTWPWRSLRDCIFLVKGEIFFDQRAMMFYYKVVI